MKRPRHWDHDGKTKRPRHTQERQADNVRRHIKGRLDKLQRTPKRQACIICGGPKAYGRKTYGRAGDHQPSQKARARSRVVYFLGGWGAHAPTTNPDEKGPHRSPKNLHTASPEADRWPRSGTITNKKNYVCNTFGTRRIFRPAFRCQGLGTAPIAHAW